MSESNNDYEDNEYYDDYEEDEDLDYEPDEDSLTKYNIIICELYNELIHGRTPNLNVKSHYLVNIRFKKFNINALNEIEYVGRTLYNKFINSHNSITHPIFRNYRNIISRVNYIKPEIAHCIYLQTNECVAILKTFWIRLIQRKWKNIIKTREEVIIKRHNPKSLKYKEIHGRWSEDCVHYPELKGMLYEIKYQNKKYHNKF
jgi:hypothetical protein